MDQGGEGIILRDPFSALESGRSSGFLKHKVPSARPKPCLPYLVQKFRDAEAKIIGMASPVTWECELYIFLFVLLYIYLFICLFIIQ